ncbi:MAG: hypothetical protein ABFD46_02740 [Armatimonadota bacterium]
MRLMKAVLICSLMVAMVLLAVGAYAVEPTWTTRPGTIRHALEQTDGTSVYLDAVRIRKNRPSDNPAYYVVGECYKCESTIIVLASLPEGFQIDQTVDVEGTLTTLDNGYRAVTNVTIYAYLDRDGNMLYHGPLVKGVLSPTQWEWKQAFASSTTSSSSMNSMSAMAENESSSNEPDPSPLAASTYYSTIAAVKSQPDDTFVELQCHPIQSVSTGYFIMSEDGTSDTIKVYYSNPAVATSRVNKITGTMKTESGQRVLCVDSGPGFDPAVNQIGNAFIVSSGTIAWAMTFPDGITLPTDGRSHALVGKLVSWCDGSVLNIQEPGGYMGIMVNPSTLPPDSQNYTVDIDGIIYSDANTGERFISGTTTYTVTSQSVKSVGMNGKSIGGSDFNVYTTSVGQSVGLYNIGTYVRVWGRVTDSYPQYGYFYIDDGSHRTDGTLDANGQPRVGICVACYHNVIPAVGSYAIVNGVLGKFTDGTNIGVAVWSYLPSDISFDGAPSPVGLSADGYNGKVLLSWTSIIGGSVTVYRSDSETGQYVAIGQGDETGYTDATVTNGTTYWYKVAAHGPSGDGSLSTAVSATPNASFPIVTISGHTMADDGLVTLNVVGYACAGGTAPTVYSLYVDGESVWDFTPAEASSIKYDTTQLPNGTHTIEIKGVGTDSAGNNAIGSDKWTFVVNNYISEFNVPDDMCGMQPISAKFPTDTSWTLTVVKNNSTLYSTSGYGNSMQVAWDAGNTYGDFQVALAAGGKTRTVKSRKDNSSSGGSYYSWASVYVKDSDPGYQGNFQYMHQAACYALQSKYGVSLYSGMLSDDNDWQDIVIDSVLNGDIPANNLVISGHGMAGVTSQKNPMWQGVVAGKFPGSSYVAGSGLTAFFDISPYLRLPGHYTPVGPAIGNTVEWDNDSGRPMNWNSTRRLRFVYIGACRAGQGVFSLAFGTPRGRYPGRGRAFLSFKDEVPGGYAQMFSERFWSAWSNSGVTVAQAATQAYWYVRNQTGYKVNYVLHGDPNLLIQ